MTRQFALLIFLFVNVLIGACTSNLTTPITQSIPTNRPTSTPAQTSTFIGTAPTKTVTSTVLLITTHAGPTFTLTASPTPELTSTPTHRVIERFVSPDEKWIATVEEQFIMQSEDGEINDIVLRVRNVEEGFEWIVETHRVTNWASSLPWPLLWSENGEYLFITHTHFVDGCDPFGTYSDFMRFDLDSGESVEMLSSGNAYDYIVSPDKHKIAALMKDGFIRIFDVDSGDSGDVSFQFNQDYKDVFLTAHWSPDSGTMIAKATLDPCHTIIGPETSYIYRIDVSTLTKTVLLSNEGEHPGYTPIEWLEPDMVLLIENGTGLNWHLNPWTGAISPTGE